MLLSPSSPSSFPNSLPPLLLFPCMFFPLSSTLAVKEAGEGVDMAVPQTSQSLTQAPRQPPPGHTVQPRGSQPLRGPSRFPGRGTPGLQTGRRRQTAYIALSCQSPISCGVTTPSWQEGGAKLDLETLVFCGRGGIQDSPSDAGAGLLHTS